MCIRHNGVKKLRHTAFTAAELALCWSIYNAMSPLSVLIVVSTAVVILAVNAIVLHSRVTPGRSESAQPIVYRIAEQRAQARRPF